MKYDLRVEVSNIGKVLEGEGAITSRLPETEYEDFAQALKDSVAEIEEPDCQACIDGRRCLCQADGSPPKIRSRKAGAGVSTMAMVGMGDQLLIKHLADEVGRPEDLYRFSRQLQETLGNREAGHFDCGAAKGLIKHTRAVATLDSKGSTVSFITRVVAQEAPEIKATKLVSDVIRQAVPFAHMLEKAGWNGIDYVDAVSAKDPAAVEKLEVDEYDPVGGHKEDAVVLVDGPVDNDGRPIHTIDEEQLFKLTGRRAFIANINEVRRDAKKLGGVPVLAAKLFAAGLLHLGGTYKCLGDGSHPVFVVRIA